MSTLIATINGRVEEKKTKRIATYEKSAMSLTRFYGCSEKGRMLQLTMSGDDGYIQITKENAIKLSKILANSFDDTIYPSE